MQHLTEKEIRKELKSVMKSLYSIDIADNERLGDFVLSLHSQELREIIEKIKEIPMYDSGAKYMQDRVIELLQ